MPSKTFKGNSFFQKPILFWSLPQIFHNIGNHIHKPHPFQNNDLRCNFLVQELVSYNILLQFVINNLTHNASSQGLLNPEQINKN